MFERVPPWLATHYDADIIGFNKDSHQWWLKMQDDHSQLFESSGFREPLYRVYQTGEKLRKAREKERDLGAVLADLGVDGILDELVYSVLRAPHCPIPFVRTGFPVY